MVRCHRFMLARFLSAVLLLLPGVAIRLQAQEAPRSPPTNSKPDPTPQVLPPVSSASTQIVAPTPASKTPLTEVPGTPDLEPPSKLIEVNDKSPPTSPTLPARPAPETSQRSELKVFALQNIQAEEVGRIIEQLYVPTTNGHDSSAIRLSVDDHTNSLIVRGDSAVVAEVEALLLRLDTKRPPPGPDHSSSALGSDGTGLRVNVPAAGPEPLALDFSMPGNGVQGETFSFWIGFNGPNAGDLQRQYDALEQRAQGLSEQLRKPLRDPATGEALKSQLRDAVRQAFETRQKLQRAELAGFVRRLQGIRYSIELREKISQQIIERRVQELLAPNLRWNSPATASQSSDVIQSEWPVPAIFDRQGPSPTDSGHRVFAEELSQEEAIWKVFGLRAELVPVPLVIQGDSLPGALKVTSIRPGSCAEIAGLKTGDVLFGLNGRTCPNPIALLDAWRVTRSAGNTKGTIDRSGQVLHVTFNWSPTPHTDSPAVPAGSRGGNPVLSRRRGQPEFEGADPVRYLLWGSLGIACKPDVFPWEHPVGAAQGFMVVTRIRPESPAALSDIRVTDFIISEPNTDQLGNLLDQWRDSYAQRSLKLEIQAGDRVLERDLLWPKDSIDPGVSGEWQLQRITGKGILGHEQGLLLGLTALPTNEAGDSYGVWSLRRGNHAAPMLVKMNTKTRHLDLGMVNDRGELVAHYFGIWKLEGDELHVALASSSDKTAERPTDFDGKSGTVQIWKRQETDPTSVTSQALRSLAVGSAGAESTQDDSRRTATSVPSVSHKSPAEMHDMLAFFEQRAEQVRQIRGHIARYEKQVAEGQDVEDSKRSLASQQRQLEEYSRRHQLAWEEYRQQLALMQASVELELSRLKLAEDKVATLERLFKKSSATVIEVQEAKLKVQEANVAKQRAEALLKVYQQAGEGLASPEEIGSSN